MWVEAPETQQPTVESVVNIIENPDKSKSLRLNELIIEWTELNNLISESIKLANTKLEWIADINALKDWMNTVIANNRVKIEEDHFVSDSERTQLTSDLSKVIDDLSLKKPEEDKNWFVKTIAYWLFNSLSWK